MKYPGLESHADHALAQKLLPKGAGAMMSFGIKAPAGGSARAAGAKLIERLAVFSHLANVGDAKSLVIHPGSTTHQQMSAAELKSAGIGEELVRLSDRPRRRSRPDRRSRPGVEGVAEGIKSAAKGRSAASSTPDDGGAEGTNTVSGRCGSGGSILGCRSALRRGLHWTAWHRTRRESRSHSPCAGRCNPREGAIAPYKLRPHHWSVWVHLALARAALSHPLILSKRLVPVLLRPKLTRGRRDKPAAVFPMVEKATPLAERGPFRSGATRWPRYLMSPAFIAAAYSAREMRPSPSMSISFIAGSNGLRAAPSIKPVLLGSAALNFASAVAVQLDRGHRRRRG